MQRALSYLGRGDSRIILAGPWLRRIACESLSAMGTAMGRRRRKKKRRRGSYRCLPLRLLHLRLRHHSVQGGHERAVRRRLTAQRETSKHAGTVAVRPCKDVQDPRRRRWRTYQRCKTRSGRVRDGDQSRPGVQYISDRRFGAVDGLSNQGIVDVIAAAW